METFIALLWFIGIVSVLLVGIKFLLFRLYSAKAKKDLEDYMSTLPGIHSVAAVKALLLVRGHFLSKELRIAAQNWIDEIEEKERERLNY